MIVANVGGPRMGKDDDSSAANLNEYNLALVWHVAKCHVKIDRRLSFGAPT